MLLTQERLEPTGSWGSGLGGKRGREIQAAGEPGRVVKSQRCALAVPPPPSPEAETVASPKAAPGGRRQGLGNPQAENLQAGTGSARIILGLHSRPSLWKGRDPGNPGRTPLRPLKRAAGRRSGEDRRGPGARVWRAPQWAAGTRAAA